MDEQSDRPVSARPWRSAIRENPRAGFFGLGVVRVEGLDQVQDLAETCCGSWRRAAVLSEGEEELFRVPLPLTPGALTTIR